jgi:serine protease Do
MMGFMKIIAAVLLGLFAVNTIPFIQTVESPADIIDIVYELTQSRKETSEYVQTDVASVAAKAKPSVVRVNAFKEVAQQDYLSNSSRREYRRLFANSSTAKIRVGTGSAFFVTADGYLLTNKHVVPEDDATYTVSVSERKEIPATVVYRDPVHDVAILKVDGADYPALSLADSSDIEYGQDIVAVGNAYGQHSDSVSSGTVSGLNRSITVYGSDDSAERMRGVIQTSATLYPGDSGGPLLDLNGQVIGVNVASAIGTDISFSIPSNIAEETAKDAGVSI